MRLGLEIDGEGEMLTGGCLCGDVRYYVVGPVSAETNCHCNTCRRSSGAPFVSWFSVPADAIVFAAGEGIEAPISEGAEFASSERGRRRFCPRCGTALTFRSTESPDEIDVTTASLDDPAALPPRDHTWAEDALPWVELGDLRAFPKGRHDAPVTRLAPTVQLRPMTQAEFKAFAEVMTFAYAKQRAEAERFDVATAERIGQGAIARLLPQGPDTSGHRICRIVAQPGDVPVGDIWYELLPDTSEVHVHWLGTSYDQRRKGYARAALALVERDAKAQGAERLSLGVFVPNLAARSLYRDAGFLPGRLQLVKSL
jgi:ribosomal protein S18 acetylase RimI-like enzyme